MDEWEKEDFEPNIPPAGAVASDKWEGEDEEYDVKESWEDEEEEKKEQLTTAYQRPKKKPITDRIAEKARTKQKEEEKVEKTPEEKLAEKIRLQKIQEEANLKLAKGLFGVGDASGIDSIYPETKEQFEQKSHFLRVAFIEKLIHDLTLTLPADDIKRIGISLNTLYHEKERQRREQAKTQKKKKPKATIRVDKADDLGLADVVAQGAYYDDDEDDFIYHSCT
ncbi:eukaryotic translation initiation factor 3 subunit J-B-like [Physella acuta]|uniref:eukaryotic translation initiation factor 3 subunit J-B-like n=1 Tax=Physella acuta TaxID=109671 RepID=UPI0027DCC3BD|nr:eukaryotic translation initiation factor 3 subunit J-B-like [Physella acuta]